LQGQGVGGVLPGSTGEMQRLWAVPFEVVAVV
jgi:hypothetical protein